MKAIVYPRYGSLELAEIEKPVAKEDRVLVKVVAASVNPLDWHLMRAKPFIVRFSEGLTRPKNPRLGADFAGVVEAVGSAVTHFKAGDEVYGDCMGAFGEYVCAAEKAMAIRPATLSYEEAAAIPVAGLTALQGLRDAGKVQAGERVLINGASGGVGHFAVQIAKAYGAEVTAVCSGRNHEMVRSIGADHAIDYTTEDFTRGGQTWDLIFDLVSNHSAAAYARALTPQGRLVFGGFSTLGHLFTQTIIMSSLLSRRGGKRLGMMETAQAKREDLDTLRELADAGKLRPVIDRRYPLEETAEAIRYLETMRARGKVVVNVSA